jgi:hypothetical protein
MHFDSGLMSGHSDSLGSGHGIHESAIEWWPRDAKHRPMPSARLAGFPSRGTIDRRIRMLADGCLHSVEAIGGVIPSRLVRTGAAGNPRSRLNKRAPRTAQKQNGSGRDVRPIEHCYIARLEAEQVHS